jgi:glycosyltransferase involved in cell wall biosynthesis
MVILEGMLYGLAIVAADIGGPAEILEDQRTGTLFPARNAEALTDALIRLVSDAKYRYQLGVAAADEVRNRWLWSGSVRRLGAVIERLARISSTETREAELAFFGESY